MPLDAKTIEFAAASGVEPDVLAFLDKELCHTYKDVALLTTEEKFTKDDLVAPMIAAGVKSAETIIGAVRIKKLWLACREFLAAANAPRAPELATDAAIPQLDELNIATHWLQRHGMVLPDCYPLADTTQGRMWRDFQMDPPRVGVWLAENLRTKASINQAVGHQLALIPGQPAVTETIIVDHVERSFELYIRARAFFHTLALVTCLTPNYFPLRTAMMASELILAAVCASYGGRAPLVQFLVQAWAETIHHFSECARMNRRTIKEIVENVAGWENRWKWSPTPGDGAGVRVPIEPDSRDLQNTVDSMRGQLRAMQRAGQAQHRQGVQGPNFGARQQRTTDIRARQRDDDAMDTGSRRQKQRTDTNENARGGGGGGGHNNNGNRRGGGGGGARGSGGGARGGGRGSRRGGGGRRE